MISAAINALQGENINNIYACVRGNNTPSLKTVEKLGFERIGYTQNDTIFHKLCEHENELIVYKYQMPKN